MRKNSKELKSLFFIRNHLKELFESEERTPLEKAFSFYTSARDWVDGVNYKVSGEISEAEYNDGLFKRNTLTAYLAYNTQAISTALYIYSLLISEDKELLEIVKSITDKYDDYEYTGTDHSEVIMIIEMLKTKGDDYKRSKEASNKSSK